MPTTQEYDERVLLKAEIRGVGALSSNELHMLKKLVNEGNQLGSRARKLVDG
jgi:hypothetical protein